jgi:hypothetical protein
LRRLLKFLHTVAAGGMTGTIAALAVVMVLGPASIGGAGYVPVMVALAKVAAWILGPSLVLTVVTGLLSMAATPAFMDAGWVWAKAATGVVILEGGLHVLGPIQQEAKRGAEALAASPDPLSVARLLNAEANTLWWLLAVSIANIALGVWRPKFPRMPG